MEASDGRKFDLISPATNEKFAEGRSSSGDPLRDALADNLRYSI